MTRLWWVRHAPTHQRALAGWRDVPADLSDKAALERLDAHLPRGSVLVSSDLSRAVATAAVLAAGRDPLPPDPALREFDFGAWDGLTFDAVAAGWPDLSRAYWESPGDLAPPGGESWNAAAARVSAAADRLAADHDGRDVVIVAHMGAILTQYARAAGLTPYQALAQPVLPLSVTCLEIAGGTWRTACVNHLPGSAAGVISVDHDP